MTKAPIPTEKSKTQRDNTENFDYTTIADRLRTVIRSNVQVMDFSLRITLASLSRFYFIKFCYTCYCCTYVFIVFRYSNTSLCLSDCVLRCLFSADMVRSGRTRLCFDICWYFVMNCAKWPNQTLLWYMLILCDELLAYDVYSPRIWCEVAEPDFALIYVDTLWWIVSFWYASDRSFVILTYYEMFELQ